MRVKHSAWLFFLVQFYWMGAFMNEELLTVEELAGVLKVPPSWVYGQTRQTGPGTIPRIRCGKYVRFIESEVMEWLRAGGKDRKR